MSKVTHDLASTNLPELISSLYSLICFKQVSFEFYSMEDRYCLYPASILPAPREFSVHWPFPIFSIKVSLICLRIFLNFSGNCLTSTEKPGGIQSIESQSLKQLKWLSTPSTGTAWKCRSVNTEGNTQPVRYGRRQIHGPGSQHSR